MASAHWLTGVWLLLVATGGHAASSAAALLAEAENAEARDPQRALVLIDSALAQLEPERDLPIWLRAQSQKCWLITYAEPERALALVADVLPRVQATSGDPQAGRLRVCAGYAHERLDQLQEAQRAYDEGIAIGHASENQPLLAKALALRGELHYVRGAYGEALSDLKAAHDAAEAVGNVGDRRYVLNAIANLYGSAGEYDRAIQYYQQSLDLARKEGAGLSVANILYNIGVTYDKLGRHDDALSQYREVLAIHEASADGNEIASTLRSMAISLIKLDRPAEALSMVDRARNKAADDAELNAALRLTRGSALRALGRGAEALKDLDAAWVWFEAATARPFMEKILDERAQALAQLGRHREALEARTAQLVLKEELHQSWRREQTARLRVEFDTDKTERENRALQTENALRAAALLDAERIRDLQWWAIVSAGLAVVALLALVAVQVRNSRKLRRVALTDELTGLPNRRATIAHIHGQWDRRAASRRPVSVVALDIDHFKRVNDTYGHDAGDVVLKRVAERLQESFRPGFVGRVGGEEFLAVLAADDPHAAATHAEKARRAVEAIDLSDVHPSIRTSSSFGIATAGPGETWEQVVKRADEALYRAKSSGRNRVVLADAA